MKVAMILAAGRGCRLKPITDTCPKALCKVNGTPLIERHVKRLAEAGFSHLVINLAYLGSKIRHHLGTGEQWGINISYSPEPPGGLETGGGIVNALPLIGTAPFACINADIVTDYDFSTLHLPDASQTHIVLVEKPTYMTNGDFGLSNSSHVDNTNKSYVFSGIACYNPLIFKDYRPGRYSVTPSIRKLASQQLVTGELYNGRWYDTGSIERLENVNKLSWD